MGDKKSDKKSKADMLIEEAVRSVEAREVDPIDAAIEAAGELQEKSPSKNTGEIAKIDLQQFVEKEAYLRLAADFENFRRRASKERQDAERSGKEKVLRDFLDILDNLDRAMAQVSDQTNPLVDGIRMVLSQIEQWFKGEGLTRIESLGKPFDPNVHEAVSQVETDGLPSGHVAQEVRRGYRWSDRLLRPAAVIVNRRQDAASPDQGGT